MKNGALLFLGHYGSFGSRVLVQPETNHLPMNVDMSLSEFKFLQDHF